MIKSNMYVTGVLEDENRENKGEVLLENNR